MIDRFLRLVIVAIVLGNVVVKGVLNLLIIGIVVFPGAVLLSALSDAATTWEAHRLHRSAVVRRFKGSQSWS